MNYKVNKKKTKKNSSLKRSDLKGYALATKNHKFIIEQTEIRNIIVLNPQMIEIVVSRKVRAKYQKLIPVLTELLVSDDDTGDCSREALNLIEKFRLEIKNKYRVYLQEKELKEMAKQLKIMQNEALKKEMEIKSFLAEEYIGRSR